MFLTESNHLSRPQIKKMEQILQDLNYDFRDFSLSKFLIWLEEISKTKLVLVARKMPAKMFGAWIASEQAHYFFYHNELSSFHKTHVILHELSHWLCGHKTFKIKNSQVKWLLKYDWSNSSLIKQYSKKRSLITNKQEQEAETLALLIQEKAARYKRANSRPSKRDRSVESFCQLLGLI